MMSCNQGGTGIPVQCHDPLVGFPRGRVGPQDPAPDTQARRRGVITIIVGP